MAFAIDSACFSRAVIMLSNISYPSPRSLDSHLSALRWLSKDLGLGYDMFESIMTAREKQAESMAKAILKHGENVYFTSDSYKPGVDLIDGSYSLLVHQQ